MPHRSRTERLQNPLLPSAFSCGRKGLRVCLITSSSLTISVFSHHGEFGIRHLEMLPERVCQNASVPAELLDRLFCSLNPFRTGYSPETMPSDFIRWNLARPSAEPWKADSNRTRFQSSSVSNCAQALRFPCSPFLSEPHGGYTEFRSQPSPKLEVSVLDGSLASKFSLTVCRASIQGTIPCRQFACSRPRSLWTGIM